MDSVGAFAAAVLIVSSSGVLAPGPLLAAGITYGMRNGASGGLLVALGHAVVELPLILALGAGLAPLDSFPHLRATVSTLGAIGLFGFAAVQVRSALRPHGDPATHALTRYGAFAAGILLSALNPFFLAWWSTIGLKLIADSQALWPVWGPQILFAIHIPMDIAWLCVVGALTRRGSRILHGGMRRALEIGLAAAMVIIGVVFALDAVAPTPL